METIDKIAVMQAFVNGAKIEFRQRGSEGWKEVEKPSWNWCWNEYRVKQQY